MHEVSVLSDFLDLFIIFNFFLSFIIILKQFLLLFNFPEVKQQDPLCAFAKEMGSTDESFSNTSYKPNHHFLTETYVEFNHKSMTEQRFPEQRFLEDVDYDDAAIGEMLFNAYREQVYHSQREGLSVGQSSSSMSDRTGQPAVETSQKLNLERAQIRTLSDRQREQILADCQAEIQKHELQADYDRSSKQKLSETIES